MSEEVYGARMAKLAGASDNQIRRSVRWSIYTCYLSNLPREILHTDFLKGDSLQSPVSLQRQIFPEIEYWIHQQQ